VMEFPATELNEYVLTRLIPLPHYVDGAMISPMLQGRHFAVDKRSGLFYKLHPEEYAQCKQRKICEVEDKILHSVKDYKCGLGVPEAGANTACPGKLESIGVEGPTYVMVKDYLIFSHKPRSSSKLMSVECNIGLRNRLADVELHGRGKAKLTPGCDYIFETRGKKIVVTTDPPPLQWKDNEIHKPWYRQAMTKIEQFVDDKISIIPTQENLMHQVERKIGNLADKFERLEEVGEEEWIKTWCALAAIIGAGVTVGGKMLFDACSTLKRKRNANKPVYGIKVTQKPQKGPCHSMEMEPMIVNSIRKATVAKAQFKGARGRSRSTGMESD